MEVEQLIRDLQDRDPVTRCDAAWELRGTRDERVVKALIRALGDHESQVRSTTAQALGQIGNPRAVGPLSQALKDEYGLVRSSAAGALGQIGDKRAMEPLIEALKDKKPAVGGMGISASDMAKFGDYFKSVVDEVHKDIVEALEAITGQDFGRDAAAWEQWWKDQ